MLWKLIIKKFVTLFRYQKRRHPLDHLFIILSLFENQKSHMISTEEKIDGLLFERAPWLNSNKVGIKIIIPILAFILGYKKTLGIIGQIKMLSAKSLMEKLAKVFIGKIKITVHSNIQSNGSQIFVCNHPTGIADGLVIWSTLSKKRPDIFFLPIKM